MKCVICRGEEIVPRSVREEIHVADDIIYVTVDALVCTQCGERYFDRATVRRLESIERELESGRETLQEIGKVLVYA
jgi:YgiT-type zinc finger domain-containing protein